MLTAMQRFMAGKRGGAAAPPGGALTAAAPPLNPNTSIETIFMPNPLTHPSTAVQSNTMLSVSRYGRIYKRRKTNECVLRKYAAPPGYRYCTYCRCALPLSAFYTKVKRYVCIRHHVERVGTYFRRRCVQTDNMELYLEEAVDDLMLMCPFLGYKTAEYDMKDMAAIISQCGIPMRVMPRAVPIDPSIPMRPRNVAIVSRQNMLLLSKIYILTNSRAAFIWFAQCCNLIPRNADAGVPENTFHDPAYQRMDIDVVPILQAERGMPEEQPVLDMLRNGQKRAYANRGLLTFVPPKDVQAAPTTTTATLTEPAPRGGAATPTATSPTPTADSAAAGSPATAAAAGQS